MQSSGFLSRDLLEVAILGRESERERDKHICICMCISICVYIYICNFHV